MMTDEDRLAILRRQINDVDDELIRCLNERFSICQEIGKVKKRLKQETTNSTREEEILNRLNKLSIYSGSVDAIWPAIFEYSKSLQK